MSKIHELKAMAYDVIANIEFLKSKLAELNAAIAKENQQEKENGSTDTHSAN